MTFGYEYTFLLLAGLTLIVYHVAHHLRPTRQNTRSLQALIAWLVVPVAFVGLYIFAFVTFGFVTFGSEYLTQVDRDNFGTVIVIALTIAACIGAWREVELVIQEKRKIASS
ncbi:MAG TPA: hypothetical protein VH591_16705 [Ktedonobacterales bacterium]|jgi:hypothetical protein